MKLKGIDTCVYTGFSGMTNVIRRALKDQVWKKVRKYSSVDGTLYFSKIKHTPIRDRYTKDILTWVHRFAVWDHVPSIEDVKEKGYSEKTLAHVAVRTLYLEPRFEPHSEFRWWISVRRISKRYKTISEVDQILRKFALYDDIRFLGVTETDFHCDVDLSQDTILQSIIVPRNFNFKIEYYPNVYYGSRKGGLIRIYVLPDGSTGQRQLLFTGNDN